MSFKMRIIGMAGTMAGTFMGVTFFSNQDQMLYAYAAAGLLTIAFIVSMFSK